LCGSATRRPGARRPLAALTLALACAGPAGAAASSPAGDVFELAHPAVRVFSDREGLPQNTVHAIDRDPTGYLWVGTRDGAARFNGRAWTVFDMPDRETSNYVRALVATRDGSIWFGREDGGVVRLRDGGFTVFARGEGLPAGRVNELVQARDGTLWAATLGGGAARFDGSRFVAVGEGLKDPRLWALAEVVDDSGHSTLATGGEGGLALLDGTHWRPVDLGPGVGSVNALVQEDGPPPRATWLGTYGTGVLLWRAGRVARYGSAQGLGSSLVTSLALTRDASGAQQLWAGTRDGGLFRKDGERFTAVPLGQSITQVYTLRAGGDDDPGALFVGSRISGLLRLEPASWVALDRSSGLPDDQVFGLLETRDAAGGPVLWVGTAGGLAVVRGRQLAVEGVAQGLPGPQVLALAELRETGRAPEVWASLVGLGLVRRVGERWQRVDARPAFTADQGASLLATSDEAGRGVLWVGTERSGLARMSSGRWSVLTTRDGLPSNQVVSLLETRWHERRTLWAGTRGGGIAEVVDGRVTGRWGRGSGLPNDDALALCEVTLPGGRREVWAGTRAGVVRRSTAPDGRWSRLVPGGEPLPSGTVVSITQDAAGRVYLGTQRGVVRLTPRGRTSADDLELLAEVFGVADGLPSAAANGGHLRDSRGRIWIATTGGVALFDPARETTLQAKPAPLRIETSLVTSSGQALVPGEALSWAERDVAFEYALLTPRRPSAVVYRTQLVGYDPLPSPWSGAWQKSYTNLPAGRYRFRVEARDANGRLTPASELAFTVLARPWLRPWAIGVELLAFLAGAGVVLRLRERALHRRARALEALVAERTHQLSAANQRLAELSVTDPLTALPNRRRLETHAEEEWRRSRRRGEGLAFVMLDVDHFKAYNDSLGHLAGDECLKAIARALTHHAQRPGDLAARYGGEEFACLLVGLDREQAFAHAERLRHAVECLTLPHPTSAAAAHVTVSLGVAWTLPDPAADWRRTLAAADEALYRAKAKGRNRTERAD